MNRLFYILLFLTFVCQHGFAQQTPIIKSKDTIKNTINPLAPSKAAFYSAILPGLGQAYNKKYWKIPIVIAGLGTSLYSYTWNNKKYHEFRDEYKDRLSGENLNQNIRLDDLTEDKLIRGQKFHQKNRDLSLLVTVGFYILNIVDANVDAHLMQFNVSDDLSVRPDMLPNELGINKNIGLTFSYSF